MSPLGKVAGRLGAGWLVGMLSLAGLPGRGAAPPVPSGRPTAQQQKQWTRLGQGLSHAALAGKMAEALRLAEEMESFARRRFGPRHWQTVDARYQVEHWRLLARLSEP